MVRAKVGSGLLELCFWGWVGWDLGMGLFVCGVVSVDLVFGGCWLRNLGCHSYYCDWFMRMDLFMSWQYAQPSNTSTFYP